MGQINYFLLHWEQRDGAGGGYYTDLGVCGAGASGGAALLLRLILCHNNAFSRCSDCSLGPCLQPSAASLRGGRGGRKKCEEEKDLQFKFFI